MKKNKILIVTTAFAPENEIGAIRMIKLVKYLVRLKQEITVISPKLHEQSRIDLSLECREFDDITRLVVDQSRLFNRFFLRARNRKIQKKQAVSSLKLKDERIISRIKVIINRFVHLTYTLVRNYNWYLMAKRKLKTIEYQDFNFVISSYPSIGAHWVSNYLKNQIPELKWVADFRDPMNYSRSTTSLNYEIYTYLQDSVVVKCDMVTSVSKGVLSKIISNHSVRSYVMYNGYDVDDIKTGILDEKPSKTSDKFIISYVGSLYGGERDLSIVFKALRELINSGTLIEIEFHYAGKDSEVIKNMAQKYQMLNYLVDYGSVSRKESLLIQSNSSLIVVATWNYHNDQGILSGKLFECLLTQKQVLAIVQGDKKNSEIKELLEYINGGVTIELIGIDQSREFTKLIDFLTERIEIWEKGVNIKYNNKQEIYSYSNIVRNFLNTIHDI